MGMYCSLRAVTPAAIQRLSVNPGELEILSEPGGQELLSLEKAWHGLHYLLTGTTGEGEMPLSFLLHGGETLGEFDPDEGPPVQLFGPDSVAEIDRALAPITNEQLWGRFDPVRMTAEGVYPVIWDEPEGDLREEYLGYFHELKKFVHQAHQDRNGLMVSIA